MIFYKLNEEVKPTILKFNITYGNSIVNFNNGNLYHLSYGILNEFILNVLRKGTDIYLHKKEINFNTLEFNEIKAIIENLSLKNTYIDKEITDLKKLIPFTDEDIFLNNFKGKWYFQDLTLPFLNLFRKKEQQQIKSGSGIIKNLTHIYAHDLIKSDILKIFDLIYKSKAKNLCIKMFNITATINYDIVKIIYYIYDEVYLFKSEQDCLFRDSWYIIGKKCNEQLLEEIKKYINNININNNISLRSILELDFDSDLLYIFQQFSLKLQTLIFKEINNKLLKY